MKNNDKCTVCMHAVNAVHYYWVLEEILGIRRIMFTDNMLSII